MAYSNRDSQSVGKVGNSWIVNKTLAQSIQSKLSEDYSNSYDFNSDAYRKKLGLILSILNG